MTKIKDSKIGNSIDANRYATKMVPIQIILPMMIGGKYDWGSLILLYCNYIEIILLMKIGSKYH